MPAYNRNLMGLPTRRMVLVCALGFLAAQSTTRAARFRPLSVDPQTPSNPLFTVLSGKWTGFTDVLQRGKCELRGGNIPASGCVFTRIVRLKKDKK